MLLKTNIEIFHEMMIYFIKKAAIFLIAAFGFIKNLDSYKEAEWINISVNLLE